MSETHRWISGLALLVGAWVFVSAFVLQIGGGHYWNNIVVGAAIVLLSGFSATQAGESATPNVWASGLSGLLGLWMIATPFVYGAATSVVLWSGVLSGIAVAVLEGYNTYAASEQATEMAQQSGTA